MDLSEIRMQIDHIDEQILSLFLQRMDCAEQVAAYKRAHNLPVFQADREEQLLARIAGLAPNHLKSGTRLLFTNIMDISKCLQQAKLSEVPPKIPAASPDPISPKVACQGVPGAYSEAACNRLFPQAKKSFFSSFEAVFDAVERGEVDFGMLPLQNSTSGEVEQTYDLMGRHNFYIHKSVAVKVEHCLCARPGTTFEDIKQVYSHEQALKQSAGFLAKNPQFSSVAYSNTAAAAQLVAQSEAPIAAICSEQCAALYGLDILARDLVEGRDNYTRFICIKRELTVTEGANIISVSLSTQNEPAALYRLLTKFAVGGLNLTRIESKPIGSKNFDVVFYLDFVGSVHDTAVAQLLADLERELSYYKFLGNYTEAI